MGGMLRLHAVGAEVIDLQRALSVAGCRVAADGDYGHMTEAAVRLFQKRHALLPDGIAGPETLRALAPPRTPSNASNARPAEATPLGVLPFVAAFDVAASLAHLARVVGAAVLPWAIAAFNQLDNLSVSRPPRSLTTSPAGTSFLYSLEAQTGVSNHLYWPTGASGVTLGAGYDMKDRDAATIKADMVKIGLTPHQADTAAGGAAKTGLTDAAVFARQNHAAISLTPAQETALLTLILPAYEKIVKSYVTVNLLQHEFDALVSFAFNPGGKFPEVSKLINSGEVAGAMAVMKKRVYSGGRVLAALVRRRNDEVNVYLYGKYVRT